MYDKILVDTSNWYHRAMYNGRNSVFKTPTGESVQTGGIHTVILMARRVMRQYLNPNGAMYYLFDNTTSVEYRRKDIDPDYKLNRIKQEPIFYRGLDFLNMIFRSQYDGNFVFQSPGSEADDLVEPLLASFPKTARVLLASNDLDWARGLGANVDWLVREDKMDVIYDEKKFEEVYGYKPSRISICLYKSFRGDDLDGVPNAVPNLPEATLRELVQRFHSIEDILWALRNGGIEGVSTTFREKILEAEGRLKLNYKLVDYLGVSKLDLYENLTATKFQPKTLSRLYMNLGFKIEKLDPRPELLPAPDKPSKPAFGFASFDRA